MKIIQNSTLLYVGMFNEFETMALHSHNLPNISRLTPVARSGNISPNLRHMGNFPPYVTWVITIYPNLLHQGGENCKSIFL